MIIAENLKKNYEIVKRKSFFSKKEYEIVEAVKGISFEINDGEKVGFIGLNGAGKTTTIKMLTGILTPTGGNVNVNGYVPYMRKKEFLAEIGVSMGQRSSLFYDIPLKHSLEYYKEVYRIKDEDYSERLRIFDEVMGIGALLDTPVRKLSFGQRMKSELVCSFLHFPKILFLDEPTIGLDVVVKENIFDFLRTINEKTGATILLTTHELENIERFCKRIIVIKEGEIIYDGKIENFCNMNLYRKIGISKEEYLNRGLNFPEALEKDGKVEFIINIEDGDFSSLEGLKFKDITVEKISLEDSMKKWERER